MSKKAVIDDIFIYYKRRLVFLEYINFVFYGLDDKAVLRDSEEVYLDTLTRTIDVSFFRIDELKRRLEKLVNLRNLLISQLSDDERYLLELRFDRGKKVYDITQELYISEATYYRKLRGIYSKLEEYYDLFEGLFND